MNTLIEKLYKKRLCLPSNAEFEDLSNLQIMPNIVKNNLCKCGYSYHIACVFKGKDH